MEDGHMDVEQSGSAKSEDAHVNQQPPTPSSSKTGSKQHTRETSVDMLATNGNGGEASTDPSSISETPADQDMEDAEPIPSIDEQVAIITSEMMVQLEDNMVGYVVATAWINRVLARSSEKDTHGPYTKDILDGEVGPIDNSLILLRRMCSDLSLPIYTDLDTRSTRRID
jgi:hypothetical protein